MKKIAVVACGGNSLIKDEKHQTVPDQYAAALETMEHMVSLIENGYEVVITHGNGPQVGFILLRSELARHVLHEVPLDSCVADTQGAIGYNFQMALGNVLNRRNIKKNVVTVVTQVVVDPNDPAFLNPTKPIGPFYTKEQALERKEKNNWNIIEDAGRGWRRVVPSPAPKEIVEIEVIKKLVEAGVIVIAVGGGGIPVIRKQGGILEGVAAVIDKDLASSLLAKSMKANLFLILTAVEKVYLNYNTPNQIGIDRMSVVEAKKFKSEGHFKPGSMLPKIEAAIDFLEFFKESDRKAIITSPQKIEEALVGKTGTHIFYE